MFNQCTNGQNVWAYRMDVIGAVTFIMCKIDGGSLIK